MKYIVLFGIIIATLFLQHFPTFYASTKTPDNYVFSGQSAWFDPWDTNVYVSAIKEGQSGSLLYENRFTTIKHSPLLVYPLYTLVGFVKRNADPFILFHATAIFFGCLLILYIYNFTGFFFKSNTERLVGTFLIVNGGGVGGILFRWIQLPDIVSPVATLYEGFQRGHVASVLILYTAALLSFYLGAKRKSARHYIISGILLAASLIFHPYNILSYAAIILLFSLYRKIRDRDNQPFIATILILAIMFFYELALMKYMLSSEGFSGLMGQAISSPNLILFILTYGVFFTIILASGKKIVRSEKMSFLGIWMLVSLVFSLLPTGFGVFYLRGIIIPLVILMLWSLKEQTQKSKILYIVAITIFCIIGISTKSLIFYKRIKEAGSFNQWFYIGSDQKKALEYLSNDKTTSNILSEYYLGNLIPAYTDDLSFYGHNNVSPRANESLIFLHYFYGNQLDDSQALEALKERNIKYVVYGPEERALTEIYDSNSPLTYDFLEKIYSNKTVIIYKY